MANASETIGCGSFTFYNNFDSANLAKVEQVKISETSEKDGYEAEGKSSKSSNSEEAVDYEFNLWTKHDCHGTQFQNNNRTWFYFGIKACAPGVCIRLNIVNLNKQVKMFSQGMCPVFKIMPGHLHWERIREKPTYTFDQKGSDFTLSFIYTAPENPKAITYFAFTYPFSYTDLQNYLRRIEAKIAKRTITCADDVYYHRECAIKSIEGRRLDILTISSFHNISTEREDRLKNMFPEMSEERPLKFWDKKIIFISARVHPGETPSSFVLNGFLNFLINRDDQIAINLRRLYVFKLIPMLNPDGVARGHYRMDTRGVNLNRVYLNPSEKDHPTIYAARNLIKYYHYSCKLPTDSSEDLCNINFENGENNLSIKNPVGPIVNTIRDTTTRLLQQVTLMTLDEKCKDTPEIFQDPTQTNTALDGLEHGEGEALCNGTEENYSIIDAKSGDEKTYTAVGTGELPKRTEDSGLYLYIDLHGHASKKGVFMYGNYFDDPEDTITCMLLPKLMSINNPNFHFTSCNFTERNMYIIDKRDGMSREGSGRVAVFKLTGLIRSYTLECNYNSGRLVNTMPARIRDGVNKTVAHMFVPPKYTPAVFEAVGAALGPSILDLTSNNPNSRLPNSQYRSLRGVKSYLKLAYVNNLSTPFSKSLHKDDNGITSHDPYALKGLDSQISNTSLEIKGSLKSESSIMKKSCIIRRTTSLYTAVKRIKSNKKPRQAVARKTLKSQCINNIENSTKMGTIRSETGVKPYSKIVDGHRTKNALGYVNDPLGSQLKDLKHASKKFTSISKLSSEETAVVQHGAKRLKVVSTRICKVRPEVGECSNNGTSDVVKQTSKLLLYGNNKNAKEKLVRAKKNAIELGKSKSSMGRKSGKDSAPPDNFLCNDGTGKILN